MLVMQRVGGYGDLLALEDDATRYEDVIITILGEQEAKSIGRLRAEIEAEKQGEREDDGR